MQKVVLFIFSALFGTGHAIFYEVTAPPGIDEVKKNADDNNLSEEQFFDCFTDINCHLGKKANTEIMDCYRKVNLKEQAEYSSWFFIAPAGNFTIAKIEHINSQFCVLEYEDQRLIGKFYIESVALNLQEFCDQNKASGKCFRLQRAYNCFQQLISEKVAMGDCKTIVKDATGGNFELQ